jgi:hypothetical protein
MVHLTILSVSFIKLMMNSRNVEDVLSYFKIMSLYLPGMTEETHGKIKHKWCSSRVLNQALPEYQSSELRT